MNIQKIIATLAAGSLALGSVVAFAQPRDDQRSQHRGNDRGQQSRGQADHHRGDNRGQQRHDQPRQYRGDDRDHRRIDPRGPQRGDRADYRGDRRGAGPDHSFYRGGRLPPQYRTRQYVVEDWRGHRLSAPPRGYHWVQTGGDYVLVAVATGIIASILLSQ